MSNFGEQIAPNAIRFTRTLPGPIDRVWAYLIDADKRATWLAGGATELHVGGHTEMHFHNASLSSLPDDPPPKKYADFPTKISFSGKVTKCNPPKLLCYTWIDGDDFSEVCYELEPNGDEVNLTLTHTRLTTRDMRLSVAGGWHTHLDILEDVLAGREPKPFWRSHSKIDPVYESRLPKAD